MLITITNVVDMSDLIPYLISAVVIPALTAYVGKTKGQRAVLPILASLLLAVLTAWVGDGIDGVGETVGMWAELWIAQLAGYLGAWKPLADPNGRSAARRSPERLAA